jgi:hypothetical protein
MNNIIFGFTGPMGSGKSEAIKTLKEHVENLGPFSAQVELVKFAAPLYDMQEYIYNRISLAHARPESFVKDRLLLQWLGTEWGRGTISANLWVDLWAATVKQIQKENPSAIIVCDDCRFDNEAAAIHEVGGKVIKISTFKSSDRIDTSLSSHPSENGISLSNVDFIIENNDSLDNYKKQLIYLFNKLGLN